MIAIEAVVEKSTESVQAPEYPTLILASASPRRHELLRWLTPSFETYSTDAEEREETLPNEVIGRLPACELILHDHPTVRAWKKARDAWLMTREQLTERQCVVLAADTDIALDGAILGKPHDEDDACNILSRLAGRAHTVYSGLCLWKTETLFQLDLVATEVVFKPLSKAEIATYVATGEALGKAGAYGLQGLGQNLIAEIRGSYSNVVGLPLEATAQLLRHAHVPCAEDIAAVYHAWLQRLGKEAPPCPPTLP